MARFSEDDHFGEDDYNSDYEEDSGEYGEGDQSAMLGAAIPVELMDRWKQSEVDLEVQKLNFIVLQQAIKMLERSWLWKFRSLGSRVRLLQDTYYVMIDLISTQD